MIKLIIQSIRQKVVWILVCGVLYPLAITAIAQLGFHDRANGSLVERGGQIVGSELIAQQFTGAEYFWPRPSAATYGTGPSGIAGSSGSNLGPTSAQLQTNVRNNAKALREAHKLPADAPVCRSGFRFRERTRSSHQSRGGPIPGRPGCRRARDGRRTSQGPLGKIR